VHDQHVAIKPSNELAAQGATHQVRRGAGSPPDDDGLGVELARCGENLGHRISCTCDHLRLDPAIRQQCLGFAEELLLPRPLLQAHCFDPGARRRARSVRWSALLFFRASRGFAAILRHQRRSEETFSFTGAATPARGARSTPSTIASPPRLGSTVTPRKRAFSALARGARS